MIAKVGTGALIFVKSIAYWFASMALMSCSGDFGTKQFEGSSLLKTSSHQNHINSVTESKDQVAENVETSVAPGDGPKDIPVNISEQMLGSTLKVQANTFEKPVTLKVSKSDTLALDQDISVLDLGSQLKMNDSSVFVDYLKNPDQNESPELKAPMVAKFRISSTNEGLSLSNPNKQYVVVYKNYDKYGSYVGVIGKNEIEYHGDYVQFEIRKFGSYQLAKAGNGFYQSVEHVVSGSQSTDFSATDASDSAVVDTEVGHAGKSNSNAEPGSKSSEMSQSQGNDTKNPKITPPENSPESVKLSFTNLDTFLSDTQEQYIEIKSVSMNKCLTLSNTRRLQEQEVAYLTFANCDQRDGQKFRLFHRGGNLFSIKTDQDTCVDIQGGSYFRMIPALGYGCHYDGNQTFQLSTEGDGADKFKFMVLHSEMCLQDQASAMVQFDEEQERQRGDQDREEREDDDDDDDEDKVEYDGFLQNTCQDQNTGQQFELSIYKN